MIQSSYLFLMEKEGSRRMIKVYLHQNVSTIQEFLQCDEIIIVPEYSVEVDVVIAYQNVPLGYNPDMNYIILDGTSLDFQDDNIFVLDSDDTDAIKSLLYFLEENISNDFRCRYLRNVQKEERILIKDATRYIESTSELSEWMYEIFYKLLVFSNEVSRYETFEDVSKKLNEIFLEYNIISNFKITEDYEAGEKDIVLMLAKSIFLSADIVGDREPATFLLMLVFEIVQSFYKREYKLKSKLEVWEAAFEKITLPAAMFSQNGELLLHNTNFLKLNILPNECMKLQDKEKIERGENVYLVKRIKLDLEYEKVQYFVFTNELQSSSIRNISAQELGIISSSVAHELNNPLAGIIAAVSLLQLEDENDQEMIRDLDEMKQGALRCKQLVEIFLGFSKKSIGGETSIIFEDALSRALNLLRFRMIESNVRVEITMSDRSETFQREINVSVVAMIFYLIFSEIITKMSHHHLVADSIRRNDNILKGELKSFPSRLELVFEDFFDYNYYPDKATLVTHLTQIENLSLEVEANKIIIS